MRDLKDYITMAKAGVPVNPGSPFNIKEDSAVIGNFTENDMGRLFAQRTGETGQKIAGEALEYMYEQSRGQPWLVNSLFKRATMRILSEDCYDTVTLDHIRQAREEMILARETHLDSLAYRLEDPAIRKVMETLITGELDPNFTETEAFRICLDLGLVAVERGTPGVANPIYREVLARHITYGAQLAMPEPEWQWKKADGSLDMDALMGEFQKFWRKNSGIWEQKMNYPEAFPHLLLMAFLRRVLNGGGRIDREYAAGRGRMDLAVEYNGQIYIIEIKLVREYNTYEEAREEGKEQITRYRDTIDKAAPAYLVIFDRRPESGKKSWEERLFRTDEDGVTVLGL
jgi:ASC-1-like (ASCH) protein